MWNLWKSGFVVRLDITALVFRKGRCPTTKQQSGISLTQVHAFTCHRQCLISRRPCTSSVPSSHGKQKRFPVISKLLN